LPEQDNNKFLEKFQAVRTGLVSILAVSFFINVLMLASPLYMLQIYDRVLTSRSTDTLLLLTLIVIAAIAVIGLLDAIRSHLMSHIALWLSRALSGETLGVTIKRTLRLEQPSTVQGLRDLDAVSGFLTTPAIYPLFDAPWSSIYLVVLFLLHPALGWIALGGASVLIIVAVINDRSTRQSQAAAGEMKMQALHHAESTVRNADVVEAMGMAPQLIDKWNQSNDKAQGMLAATSAHSGSLTATSRFIRLGIQVAILGYGALLVIDGELTAGAIVAASILVGRALAPVDQAIATWRSGLAAKAAFDRLKQHFHNQHGQGETMTLPKPKGEISVEGLSYAYPGTRKPVLRNVNFQLPAGEVLALIGPSGSGKTTLVRVLLGNLVAPAGHARLDGMDVAQWDSSDRGAHIGYLPQDVELFAGTVRENIARMTTGDSEKVIEAAKRADVHDLILHLPRGYDTAIGNNGMVLSGGQRQRIALARALYDDPSFVVLDEPNANLDQEGNAALSRTLVGLRDRGVTTIIISHRSGVFDAADKVMLLREGTVAAYGATEEILKSVSDAKSAGADPALPGVNHQAGV
jgi:ATP-binding cassette, subfamily C, type I secretion system permease/ATPase